MSNTDQAITATDFLNYAYCPRIIHFVHVLRQPQGKTVKERKGQEKYQQFTQQSRRSVLIPDFPLLPRKYNLYLYDSGSHLKTFADCVLFDEGAREAYPYQLKYGHQPPAIYLGQRFQLWLEAWLIERLLSYTVPRGYIGYIKSDTLATFELGDKGRILDIARQIEDIIATEQMPEPTPFPKRCVDCCFNRICVRDNGTADSR